MAGIPIGGIRLVTFRGQRVRVRENGTFTPGGRRIESAAGLDGHTYQTAVARLAAFSLTVNYLTIKEIDEIEKGPPGTLSVTLESGEVLTIEEARASVDEGYDATQSSVAMTFSGAAWNSSGLP